MAENERAIVITHRESDLRFKMSKEVEFVEDKFTLQRYTYSLSRFLKFHAPLDKYVAHITGKIDSLDN